MLNCKPLSRALLLGTLCTASFGCSDSTTTTTRMDPATDPDVTVTARKPVIPENQDSSTGITPDQTNGSGNVDPTDTGVNTRDQDDLTKTPLDQYENDADLKITADIRRRVVDTEMSVDAQNVKIITQDGKVTLRGPVRTADEKSQIEKIATDIAGKDMVDSQLEIATN